MLRINCRKMLRRRRKGMTIVESLILMVVLMVAIWAIMSTALWSSELVTFSRQSIGLRTLASNWFEAFESINPKIGFVFSDAVDEVRDLLGGTGDHIWGYKVAAREVNDGSTTGIRTVELTLQSDAGKGAPYVITRDVNARSSETVSDDRKRT